MHRRLVRPSFRILELSRYYLPLCSFSSHPSLGAQAPRTTIHSPKEQVKNPSTVIAKFLRYPREEFRKYMTPFLREDLVHQLDVFNDHSLMIRQPTLTVMKDLMQLRQLQKQLSSEPTDTSDHGNSSLLSQTVPRFVMYGQPGCGISTILAQLSHFVCLDDWLIFPFVNAEHWLDRCMDLTHSNDYHQEQHRSTISGDAFDFPSRSANWLQKFTQINENFLNKFRPVTTREVSWTRADIMPVGTPWLEVVDFATTRTKYSTDCIGILLREMRHLCSQPNGPPCLLVIDGVNFLWCRGTRLKDKLLQVKVTVDRLAIVHHLRRALKADWRHGAVITSLNIRGAWPTDREKYTPGYLLGRAGFEAMDPFIPVQVDNYNATEMDACLRFYAENHWLTNPAAHTEDGRAQITFLSANNPRELDRIAAEW